MPTDWKALLPDLKADVALGKGIRQIALERNLPFGSVARWLRKPEIDTVAQSAGVSVTQTPSDSATQEKVEALEGTGTASAPLQSTPSPLQPVRPSPEQSPLEIARQAARQSLIDIASGRVEGDASRMAAIKLLLKDELEPEVESNPYVGQPTEELGLRAITLAVAVLGLNAVAKIIRDQARAGTLDLGLDWTPLSAVPEAVALTPEAVGRAVESVNTDERPEAGDGLRVRQSEPARVTAEREVYGVETLG